MNESTLFPRPRGPLRIVFARLAFRSRGQLAYHRDFSRSELLPIRTKPAPSSPISGRAKRWDIRKRAAGNAVGFSPLAQSTMIGVSHSSALLRLQLSAGVVQNYILKSCSNSVPGVPDHKLHGAVDAGIVAAERGIGQVVDLYSEIPRILGLAKPLYSELGAAGEVDLRGVGCR